MSANTRTTESTDCEPTQATCAQGVQVTLNLGPELFHFRSFRDWIDHATSRFTDSGYFAKDTIGVDTRGRIVGSTADFKRTEEDNAYPVRFFAKHTPAEAAQFAGGR